MRALFWVFLNIQKLVFNERVYLQGLSYEHLLLVMKYFPIQASIFLFRFQLQV